MASQHAAEWRKTRESGCTAWVIKRGILGFGLPMSIVFAIPAWINSGIVQALLVFVSTVLIGGLLFGLTTWKISEWRYRGQEKLPKNMTE